MPKGRVVYAPTAMQKQGVDNILSGKYRNFAPALRDAGYTKSVANAPGHNFFNAQGVQLYLKTLSKVAKKRWNVSLPDKVALTYLDGLEATKLAGKDAIEHPDFATRLTYADRFAEFFGWRQDKPMGNIKNQQFNFFSVDEKERQDFNENFKTFLKQM